MWGWAGGGGGLKGVHNVWGSPQKNYIVVDATVALVGHWEFRLYYSNFHCFFPIFHSQNLFLGNTNSFLYRNVRFGLSPQIEKMWGRVVPYFTKWRLPLYPLSVHSNRINTWETPHCIILCIFFWIVDTWLRSWQWLSRPSVETIDHCSRLNWTKYPNAHYNTRKGKTKIFLIAYRPGKYSISIFRVKIPSLYHLSMTRSSSS